MTWHLAPPTLSAYLEGRVADADAWSVEAHLSACERCRAALAAGVRADPRLAAELDHAWMSVSGGLAVPRRPLPQATRLRELRMLAAAGPAARWAWLVATTVTLALAAGLGAAMPWGASGQLPLLGLLAPLTPLLGVAASYGTGLDDAHEVIASTPGGGMRLLLVRGVTVLTLSTAIGLGAGAVTGYGSPIPWLLASLGLTSTTLALSSLTGVGRAAAAVGFTWVLLAGADVVTAPERTGSALLTPVIAPVWLALIAATVLVLVFRRAAFDHMAFPARPRMEI